MRKFCIFIQLMTALTIRPICGDELEVEPVDIEETAMAPDEEDDTPEPGMAAASSAKTAQTTNWQNWIVAGGALITAAVGVIVVATNSGSSAGND